MHDRSKNTKKEGVGVMKYLWIEDFNQGKDGLILKQNWLNNLDLKEDDMIIKENLLAGLSEIRDNPANFDAVILDINIPLVDKDKDKIKDKIKGEIYEEYFKEFMIKDKYMEYIDKETTIGMLAFLYLIHATNFPLPRIAFYSANTPMKSDEENIGKIDVEEIIKAWKSQSTEGIQRIHNVANMLEDRVESLELDEDKKKQRMSMIRL